MRVVREYGITFLKNIIRKDPKLNDIVKRHYDQIYYKNDDVDNLVFEDLTDNTFWRIRYTHNIYTGRIKFDGYLDENNYIECERVNPVVIETFETYHA
jgi:hypothetical protein